jgi:hypothetical protein
MTLERSILATARTRGVGAEALDRSVLGKVHPVLSLATVALTDRHRG